MIRRAFWAVFGWSYVHLLKPVLFLTSPDSAHKRVVANFKFMGKFKSFRLLVRAVFKPKYNKAMAQTIAGVKFVNPVGLSAGFDKNAEVVPIISNLGFGFGEVGSITADVCKGNAKPWFYRLPKTKSLVVNVGLANHGSEAVLARLSSRAGINKDYPVILSVAKANSSEVVTVKQGIDDYIMTIKRADKNKFVRMIEINISCPNTFGGEPFTGPDNLELLLRAVEKLKVKKPIIVKMPSNLTWAKTKDLLDVIVKHNVAGVTVANLMKNRDRIHPEDKSIPEGMSGSLSGMPSQAVSDELIRNTYKEYGDKLVIIGVGGIFSADDAYRKIRLGASLVEFITAMIFVGPQLASQINDGIARRLKRDGFTHIKQAIGVDARK